MPSSLFNYSLVLLAAVVMNVMVEMLSNTSVIVSWESIDTSELTISYRVYYYYYYNQSGDMDAFVNASSNSIVIDNLISIVEYLFYVVVIAEVDGQIFIGQRSMTIMIVAVSTTECMLCYHDWLIITKCFLFSSWQYNSWNHSRSNTPDH